MARETLRIAGTKFYEENIKKLLVKNPEYDLKSKDLASRYTEGDIIPEFIPGTVEVVLEPEPDNQYDPNAIKVMMNGLLVGYVKKGSCSHVEKLLQKPGYKAEAVTIQIGKFKQPYGKTVEINTFAEPFIRIAISYDGPEEEIPSVKTSSKEPDPEEPSDRSKKLKKTKIRLSIVAVIAWILLSALCHLIDPAIVLGIIFIIVISEIFKRFK